MASNFQEKVQPYFEEFKDNLMAWIDDLLLFYIDEEHLAHIIPIVFEICLKRCLMVSFSKSQFFLNEVTLFGRIIDSEGTRFLPKKISGLMNCDSPRTASELCETFHGLNCKSLTFLVSTTAGHVSAKVYKLPTLEQPQPKEEVD